MFRDLNIAPDVFNGVTLQRGRGCDRCNNTGYSGRLAIVEAMTITDEIRKAVIARASSMEIGKIAIGQGMKTLRQVALDKVRDGVTTLEQTLVITAGQ
jgi:type IV pilus assembly protein PilB